MSEGQTAGRAPRPPRLPEPARTRAEHEGGLPARTPVRTPRDPAPPEGSAWPLFAGTKHEILGCESQRSLHRQRFQRGLPAGPARGAALALSPRGLWGAKASVGMQLAERRGPFRGSPGSPVDVNKQMHNGKVPQKPGALGARGERGPRGAEQTDKQRPLNATLRAGGEAEGDMNKLEGAGRVYGGKTLSPGRLVLMPTCPATCPTACHTTCPTTCPTTCHTTCPTACVSQNRLDMSGPTKSCPCSQATSPRSQRCPGTGREGGLMPQVDALGPSRDSSRNAECQPAAPRRNSSLRGVPAPGGNGRAEGPAPLQDLTNSHVTQQAACLLHQSHQL